MDISKQYFPGRKYIKDTMSRSKSWEPAKEASFVLYRGIVVDILMDTEQNSQSSYIPPFSCNIKIIGEDITTTKDPASESKTWYAPFQPTNIITLPELGEEVLVIREISLKGTAGYWIGRVNNNAFLSRYLTREYATGTPKQVYGFDFNVRDIADFENGTTNTFRIKPTNLKPGDVAIQGRSGSYQVHSFLPENKYPSIVTGTRTNHLGGRFQNELTTRERTRDAHISHSSFDKQDFVLENEDVSTRTFESFLVRQADKFVDYSSSRTSEENLYSLVKGEKLNEYFEEVFGTLTGMSTSLSALSDAVSKNLKKLNEQLKLVVEAFNAHSHTIEGEKLTEDIDLGRFSSSISVSREIMTPSGPRTVNDVKPFSVDLGTKKLEIEIEDKTTEEIEGVELPDFEIESEGFAEALQKMIADVNSLTDNMKEHLSKNHFIN